MFKQYPVIKKIKEKIVAEGALGSLMTGTGPTVFGLFEDEKKARNAAEELKDFGKAFVTRTK